MLIRTEGIVLKNQRFAEADLIVTFLTPDRGIISAFAKSPRRMRSRFGSSLEPLTHVMVSFMGKEYSMPRITQSDIINPFTNLREDYQDFVNISRLIRLILSLVPNGIPNKGLYNLFHVILILLSTTPKETRRTLHLVFIIRLLAMIGYAPRLNKCGRCGDSGYSFYPDSGTILCDRCIDNKHVETRAIKVSKDVINFYTHSIEWPLRKLPRLKPSEEMVSNLSALIERHIAYNLGIKI
ncbi:MAG: DNA repair protein RecO [Thermodesulfovibrionia bacterium]